MQYFGELQRNQHSIDVEIDASQVASPQQNFPMMLETPNSSNSVLNIVAMNSFGEQLPTEIEGVANDKNWVYLKDSIQDIVNHKMKVFYGGYDGKPAANSTYGSEAVWNGYSAIYHMSESPILDSTSNGNDATVVGGDPTLSDGTHGKKMVFDGNDYFNVPDAATLDFSTTDFDILMVLKADSTGTSVHSTLLAKLNPETATQWAIQYFYTTGYFNFREAATNHMMGNVGMLDNTEHIINFHRESGTFYWDVDVVNKNSVTVTRNLDNAALLSIGRRSSSYGDFRGDMSEIRIIKDTISTNYRNTTYNNLNNPTASGNVPFYKSISKELNFAESLQSFGRAG